MRWQYRGPSNLAQQASFYHAPHSDTVSPPFLRGKRLVQLLGTFADCERSITRQRPVCPDHHEFACGTLA
jgi:hypothetical protein